MIPWLCLLCLPALAWCAAQGFKRKIHARLLLRYRSWKATGERSWTRYVVDFLVSAFLGLLIFGLLLYLLSFIRQDGRSALLESSLPFDCIRPGPPRDSEYCRSITHTAYRFDAPWLVSPLPSVPHLLDKGFWDRPTTVAQLEPYPPMPMDGFYVVTYSSSLYYDRLLNFLGSMHFFEPTQIVLVYDLGMTPAQLSELHCLSWVEVRHLKWEKYPLHVSNMFNYAWKILVMAELGQDPAVKSFFVIDSGAELAKPFALTPIKEALKRNGFWGVLQSNFVTKKTHPSTLAQIKADLQKLEGKPFCAGGVIAFVVDSDAYRNIVP